MTLTELAESLLAELEEHVQAIRYIANRLKESDSSDTMSSVPYHSQWEQDAMRFSGDCGPACLAMLIEWRTGIQVPVDQLAVECNMTPSRNTTMPGDLLRVAQAHGVTLIQRVVDSVDGLTFPSIVLVHYEDLPRIDLSYKSGHWVVALSVEAGQVIYHDPDWWGNQMAQGAARRVSIKVFGQAMYNCKKDGNLAGLTLGVAR